MKPSRRVKIPAKAAGVKKIVVCSLKPHPAVLAAADWAGADLIFQIGGVQAIAAMAYGTETVPKVDKVVGPGNIYVTQAKSEIFGSCGIDLLAGPSEILIIADKTSSPDFIAADLLAQAEHDPLAQSIFISNDAGLLGKVKKEVSRQSAGLGVANLSKQVLKKSNFILTKDINQAISIANDIAPEHLVLAVKNPKQYLKLLKNFGSLFLGQLSVVAFGDYCSGTNHVLPTEGSARFSSGLSVKDFLRMQTYQYIKPQGVKRLAPIAKNMALAEGLKAHMRSVAIREVGLKKSKSRL